MAMYEDAFTPLEPLDELGPSSPLPIDVERALTELRAPEANLRMQAARIFCDIEDPRATEPLVTLLSDPCPLVRVSAAYALGRNTDARVVDTLIATLRQDWNGYVRKGLVWALGNSRDPRAIPAIINALCHDITAVRLWSASALGQLACLAPSPHVEHEIIKALAQTLTTDPIAAVRSNAAWSLGQMQDQIQRDPDVADRICQLLLTVIKQDSDLGVKDDVRLALGKIAGREWALEMEEWGV